MYELCRLSDAYEAQIPLFDKGTWISPHGQKYELISH